MSRAPGPASTASVSIEAGYIRNAVYPGAAEKKLGVSMNRNRLVIGLACLGAVLAAGGSIGGARGASAAPAA